MSVNSADLWKAINAAWDASDLDSTFSDLWSDKYDADDYEVLSDQEASPDAPFPYCVADMMTGNVVEKMSGGASALRIIRDTQLNFNVHAKERTGDSRSAKELAAYLAEEVMKQFGGHPTSSPGQTLTLDNGNHLITQFVNDYGVRTGDEEYQWVIQYNFKTDTPEAV